MSGQAQFRRLFAWEAWANRESLTSAVNLTTAPPQVVQWLGHLAGTGAEWRARLTGTTSRLAVWPELSLAQCEAEFALEATEWKLYLGALVEDDLTGRIEYRNSKGERWTSTVEEILTHVVLHGSYHRGQIASAIRAAGGTPAYTDFIHAARTGVVPK
jgi:uncharacterized damage-inducible protein DinB